MGKAIAYTIFALIGAFFLFGPLVGLYFASRDTLTALGYDGRESGVVTACRSTRVRSNSGGYITAPVVQRASGGVVYGTVDEVRFVAPCEAVIGETVPVRFDLDRPQDAQIATFHQMWLQPLFLGLLCLLFYGVIGFVALRARK